MNENRDLDPEARLRAADPAADVEPRAGFVDEVVADVTRSDAATGEPATSDAPEVPVADLAAERHRRAKWVPWVAVAASLIVFGGAGYAVGATTGGSTDLAEGAAPPISLQGAAGGAGTPEGMAQEDASAAVGDAKRSAQGAADMMYPAWGGRNSFTSSGLGTSEGSALAYAFDARAASNVDTVSALAASFGIAEPAELQDGLWIAGPQDGTAPSLSVSLDGTLSFFYTNPLLNPWACESSDGAVGAEGGGDAGSVDGVDPVVPCEPTGTPPAEDVAIDALRSVITSAGRDADAFEYSSEAWEGAVTRTAQAWPVVDGQRLDQAWTAEVAEDGLVSASGALAGLVPLGEYDVVSEQQAFERLSDPRFGAQMTAMPLAAREEIAVDDQPWVAPTEPPAAPSAGSPVSWTVNDVEIVSARLGLASQWQPDGSVLEVPAYEFTDAGGGTWSIIAVADAMLDFAPVE
ncbi:hypothetical protein [Agromyces salentinus]|uniref:Uncharacterized protein n=1 Tax=Agromyces salentinus TaxID=269421 RepID=A0ABP4Z0C6_9MICO|nr:hypothetical protein [Agromyces salentinus]